MFGNEVKFYLPSLIYFFIPKISEVYLLKFRDLYHCTKSLGSRGQYATATFQKSHSFRQQSIVRQN